MGIINLTKTLKGKTGWVSLSQDYKRIITQGKTLKELINKLKKLGNPKGHIMYSVKDYSGYAG